MEVSYTPLQVREVFHLEFLRWFGRRVNPRYFSLKGGVNLRLFFNSFRYSEDMDLDVHTIGIANVRNTVMKVLQAAPFQDSLKPFGINRIVPPDISKAKQTQTTQRFKLHIITDAQEDLFTKIEFSRRKTEGNVVVQPVSSAVLRVYKLPPLVVPHYDIQSAIIQKIQALSMRAVTQPRDIFDLYILSSQYTFAEKETFQIAESTLQEASGNIFHITFEQFRDMVVCYLSPQDQSVYNSASLWDEVKLKTADFIEEIKNHA